MGSAELVGAKDVVERRVQATALDSCLILRDGRRSLSSVLQRHIGLYAPWWPYDRDAQAQLLIGRCIRFVAFQEFILRCPDG